MRAALPASALLHALMIGAALAGAWWQIAASPLQQPAEIVLLFAAPPTVAALAATSATTTTAPTADAGAGETATAAAPPSGGATWRPGVRLDRPDPSVIAAREEGANQPPAYPPGAIAAHEQGTAVLRLSIDAQGTVTRLVLVTSSGYRDLDEAAAAALATWHFRPAEDHGVKVASVRDQPVRFALE